MPSSNGLTDNTLVIFTSDNGPVLDDGYQDMAVELNGEHQSSGPFRGGKYSAFEAGTRVPFIVRWPERVDSGESRALFSQVDLAGSLAALFGHSFKGDDAVDSQNQLSALLGEDVLGREYVIEHNSAGALSLRKGKWKFISPNSGRVLDRSTNIELGNDPSVQLYDLEADIGERQNVAVEHPQIIEELSALLESVRIRGSR